VSLASAMSGSAPRLAGGDDESPADGEVGLPMQGGLVGGDGGNCHAVGVEVQRRPGVQRDVVLGQSDWDSSTEQDLAGAAQPFSPIPSPPTRWSRADTPSRPSSTAGSVPWPRPVAASDVELDSDVANPVEHTHRIQVSDEVRSRPHRADGMRTGRTCRP
jgi:hypothetical protein